MPVGIAIELTKIDSKLPIDLFERIGKAVFEIQLVSETIVLIKENFEIEFAALDQFLTMFGQLRRDGE